MRGSADSRWEPKRGGTLIGGMGSSFDKFWDPTSGSFCGGEGLGEACFPVPRLRRGDRRGRGLGGRVTFSLVDDWESNPMLVPSGNEGDLVVELLIA